LTGEAISLVAPDDLEALAAIEKLIKKRIERVLVPGFEPNAGTLAALMGGEPSRRGRPRETRKSLADPIFSKPYEPAGAASAVAAEAKPEPPRTKRRQPQIAALLGGLKRA
jgi:ATP-dependent RNA helicase RhlE